MNIYELLKKDHVEVKEMLEELIALNENDDYRTVLVEQIASALIPHARAEESVLYNSIRAVSTDSTIMHAYTEHMEAEKLVRSLQAKNTANFDWKKTAIKLKEALELHIAEEEGKVFTEARNIFSEEEATMMGNAFAKLKGQVAKEGFRESSFDLVVNLMPPGFVDKIRELKPTDAPEQR